MGEMTVGPLTVWGKWHKGVYDKAFHIWKGGKRTDNERHLLYSTQGQSTVVYARLGIMSCGKFCTTPQEPRFSDEKTFRNVLVCSLSLVFWISEANSQTIKIFVWLLFEYCTILSLILALPQRATSTLHDIHAILGTVHEILQPGISSNTQVAQHVFLLFLWEMGFVWDKAEVGKESIALSLGPI